MRPPLTGRGWLMLGIGLALTGLGALLGSRAFTGFGALCVLVVLLSFVFVRLLPIQIGVQRSLSAPLISVGERATVTIDVATRNVVPLTLAWRDTAPDGISSTARGVTTVSSRHRAQAKYDFIATSRGRHLLGPVSFVLADAFGLTERYFTTSQTQDLWVSPRLLPLQMRDIDLGSSGAHSGGLRDRSEHSTVDVIPRPYTSGDSVRRVHWRATARSGELMVRQEALETSPEMHLILDLAHERWSPFMHPVTRESAEFEHAVSVATTVALLASRDGYHVRVATETADPLGELDGSTDAVQALKRIMAELQPEDEAHEEEWLLGQAGTQVLLITGHVHLVDAQALARWQGREARTLIAVTAEEGAETLLTAHGWRVLDADAPELHDQRGAPR